MLVLNKELTLDKLNWFDEKYAVNLVIRILSAVKLTSDFHEIFFK